MAVTNRTLDASEQKKTIDFKLGPTATGATAIIAHVPYNCTLNAIQVSAFGLSNSPQLAVVNNRFIVGSGVTAMTVATGTSNTLVAFGTSGVGSSGLLIGSSFVNLLANDVLMVVLSVANSNVLGLAGQLVVQPIQDIKTFVGGLA